jgi:hypothetical protein
VDEAIVANLGEGLVAKSDMGIASSGKTVVEHMPHHPDVEAGNTKRGSSTVPLTSCLTSLESAV